MYWELSHIKLFYALGYDKMAAHLVELERAAGTSDLMLSRYTYPKDMSQAERAAECELSFSTLSPSRSMTRWALPAVLPPAAWREPALTER